MRNVTKEEAKDIIAALKTLGYEEVEYTGWNDHIDDADMIYFFNPKTKKGMYIAISDPTDQQTFDDYFVRDVDEQFGENLLETSKDKYESLLEETLIGKTLEEAMVEFYRTEEILIEALKPSNLKVNETTKKIELIKEKTTQGGCDNNDGYC